MIQEKISGVYCKKQFDAPKPIGDMNENLEQISIFPTFDSFIDVKLTNGMITSKITISVGGQIWSGTMTELIEKLK